MSKKCFALIAVCVLAQAAQAGLSVSLYADSAPNAYGSPAYAPWKASTFSAVAGGTMVNMPNGAYPGTTVFSPYDAIVYSTGDLGSRLHWIYWIPNATVEELNGRFQVKDVYDWDGVNYTYDWGTNAEVIDGPEAGWIQPGSWVNYNGGVIGTFGNAFWAWDDAALPLSTNAAPYDETNQGDIDALAQMMRASQTHWTGMVRYRDTVDSPWQVESLKLTMVPAPGAAVLCFMGLGLVGWVKRRLA